MSNNDESCLFCRIIRGEEAAYIVYNDQNALAFLDRFPIVPGHTLVVTREHYKDFLSTPSEESARLAGATKTVANAVKSAMKADGIRLFTNVGRSAGQVIFHVHVHILPSWENEPAFVNFRKRNEITHDEAIKISNAIKEEIRKQV